MTAASRRASRLESDGADALGAHRVRRRHVFERAPDMSAVRLASGEVLQGEAKSRKRLPRVITGALAQARGYAPGAVPVAILREMGGEAIAALPLADFVRLLGIKPPVEGEQLWLLGRCA